MKISIIAVGKLKQKYFLEGVNEYSKRLSRFCDLQIVEVEDQPAPEKLTDAQKKQVKQKEAKRIKNRLTDNSVKIVLDVKGQNLDSVEFAEKIENYFLSGFSHISFIIGGSLGVDENLLKTAHFRLSLSKLTLLHQMTRLILLEQLFRAFKIINGEPYHK